MPWGYGRNKRSRDLAQCEECGDFDIDFEEGDYGICGECQRTMCEDCAGNECYYCKQEYETTGDLHSESTTICEGCMQFCELCQENEDGETHAFHPSCLSEHMKNCNSQSRASGAYRSAQMKRKEKETQLAEAQRDLARAQSNVQRLTRQVEEAKNTEAQAKSALDAEDAKKPAGK